LRILGSNGAIHDKQEILFCKYRDKMQSVFAPAAVLIESSIKVVVDLIERRIKVEKKLHKSCMEDV
jgi:hypothetical protein